MDLPEVSMIWAMTPRGVIGNNGKLPWKLPRDMRRFMQLTTPRTGGNPIAVVMGPKTLAEIGKPLKNRVNIVLTTDRNFSHEGVLVAHDPLQARELAVQQKEKCCEFFVIGGAMVYAAYIADATNLFVTYVWSEMDGDRHFPSWNQHEWYKVWEEPRWRKGARDDFPTKFAHFRRLQKPETTSESWKHPKAEIWKKQTAE